MAKPEFKRVAIVGVGLLGGSAGLAIRACWPKAKVVGVGRRQASLDAALEAGAIHAATLDPVEAAKGADLVLLATPVAAFEKHLRAIAPALARGAVVTDVGSTKAAVLRMAARALGKGGPFVGSHPMAGSERKGVAHADAALFAGATCILTPTADTPRRVADRVEGFWRALGARTVRMTPAAHDRAMARVSHLPHVLAALLMRLPREAELAVAATGFRDATRLAGGDPEMWRDILLTNRRAILAALDAFDEGLVALRDLIDAGDAPGIERFLSTAQRRRSRTVGANGVAAE